MDRPTDNRPPLSKWLVALVWFLRIAVGATFIMSGLVKLIDLWGFVYKIEEYLKVWNIESWRSLNFVAAMSISGLEFVSGSMLLLGAFRRSVVWWLLAMMAVLLPLTFYIMVDNPVSDCGCFGDFWIISNTATFVKNLFITAGLIVLAVYNRRVGFVYNPYVQWIPMLLCSVYALIVGLIGYNIQPMIDFRSFAPGSELIRSTDEMDDEDDETELTFLYEKNGETRSFTLDNLPDSTWTFVDRESRDIPAGAPTDFTIIDDGVDIAPDIISEEGEQLILTIPEILRADISYTLLLNEIYEHELSKGGSMICLVGSGTRGVDIWQDYSMAQYPIYSAEPTLVKELARGNMALVCLKDGVVSWKRTVSSLSLESSASEAARGGGLVAKIALHGGAVLGFLTLVLVSALFVLAVPGAFISILRLRKKKK